MLKPMLASLADAPLDDPDLVYEPKYDGIRAIAEVPAGGHGVRLWSRLGNEKTRAVSRGRGGTRRSGRARRAVRSCSTAKSSRSTRKGEPTGFQKLQGRIHLSAGEPASGGASPSSSSTCCATATATCADRPLDERRAALEARVRQTRGSPVLRISEQVRGDGRGALRPGAGARLGRPDRQARGVAIPSGKRSPDWRKLKIVQEQEFVDRRLDRAAPDARPYFGALLLGVYDDPAHGRSADRTAASPRLVYVGHTGTGFDRPASSRA